MHELKAPTVGVVSTPTETVEITKDEALALFRQFMQLAQFWRRKAGLAPVATGSQRRKQGKRSKI